MDKIAPWKNAETVVVMTLRIKTLGKMSISNITLGIMPLSIMTP
jgi:hypothetical protein